MRTIAVIFAIVFVTGCGGSRGHPTPPDMLYLSQCPVNGPSGPPYCIAPGTSGDCGPCGTIGMKCNYGELILACACDYHWRCWETGFGNCVPDGGYCPGN